MTAETLLVFAVVGAIPWTGKQDMQILTALIKGQTPPELELLTEKPVCASLCAFGS